MQGRGGRHSEAGGDDPLLSSLSARSETTAHAANEEGSKARAAHQRGSSEHVMAAQARTVVRGHARGSDRCAHASCRRGRAGVYVGS